MEDDEETNAQQDSVFESMTKGTNDTTREGTNLASSTSERETGSNNSTKIIGTNSTNPDTDNNEAVESWARVDDDPRAYEDPEERRELCEETRQLLLSLLGPDHVGGIVEKRNERFYFHLSGLRFRVEVAQHTRRCRLSYKPASGPIVVREIEVNTPRELVAAAASAVSNDRSSEHSCTATVSSSISSAVSLSSSSAASLRLSELDQGPTPVSLLGKPNSILEGANLRRRDPIVTQRQEGNTDLIILDEDGRPTKAPQSPKPFGPQLMAFVMEAWGHCWRLRQTKRKGH